MVDNKTGQKTERATTKNNTGNVSKTSEIIYGADGKEKSRDEYVYDTSSNSAIRTYKDSYKTVEENIDLGRNLKKVDTTKTGLFGSSDTKYYYGDKEVTADQYRNHLNDYGKRY